MKKQIKRSGIPVQLLVADTGSEAFKQLDEDAADYTARELKQNDRRAHQKFYR